MLIRFGAEVEIQEIFAVGDELASVMGQDRNADGGRVYSLPDTCRQHVVSLPDPVLVTDHHRIGLLEPTLRDTVFKLYESARRTIQFRQTVLDFEQHRYPGVWGPSIDTLICCGALDGLDLRGVRRFAEVGAGSGFISKHLISCAPDLEEITLIDLNPHAIRCCRDHIHDDRVRFVVGDAVSRIGAAPFDLIVCNPPYIPRPDSRDDNPYEGTGLLKFLLLNARELLGPTGRLVTIVSSLSEHTVLEHVEAEGLNSRAVASREVPLKVCNVLNNAAWLRFLLERGLRTQRRDGYDYWQRIAIFVISFALLGVDDDSNGSRASTTWS